MSAMTAAPAAQTEKVYTFTYKARNHLGEKVRGQARGTSRQDVLTYLTNELKVTPLEVAGGPGSATSLEFGGPKKAKHKAMVVNTRMLAMMLGSGLDPVEAIDIVIHDCEDLVLRDALTEVRMEVAGGTKLSKAMEKQPVFPPTIVSFVAAGEVKGDIKGALKRVADQYETENKLRSQIRKAMIYPILALSITALVFLLAVIYIVPKFAEQILEMNPEAKLPLITRFVLGCGDIAIWALPIGALLTIPSLIWYGAHKRDDNVRDIVDKIRFSLPVFGLLNKRIALARYTRNLSGMLLSGVDRLEALEATSKTVGNVYMERAIMKARESVREGESLVVPLREEPLFANRVLVMTAAGLKAGELGQMMDSCADLYDMEVDEMAANMTTLIAPMMTLVVGGSIGILAAAIYLPYLTLLSNV